MRAEGLEVCELIALKPPLLQDQLLSTSSSATTALARQGEAHVPYPVSPKCPLNSINPLPMAESPYCNELIFCG
ncbi:MAG: hypothetical protein IGS38_16920 [Synechococcales cyanobacterium M58_A2018_015]|nr:hypothetical protein [Synechococcales cyanobacterium M58_A2018_015]